MKNWTIEGIKEYGFTGFQKISDLVNDYSKIPDERGVYLIIKSDFPIKFIEVGTGGFFKNKNPNVGLDILSKKWVDKSEVLYIGQAGGIRAEKWSNTTLRERLKLYFNFGQGKSVAHKGGRYIWQIQNNLGLMVSWIELPNKIADPRLLEKGLISTFVEFYGAKPFANLNR
ncbi:hypothetical protein GWA97_09440 [Flavobacterium sp. LaA7.5]|nr:hypothetical protein [Flavobacterium salilacus subsp. altitudinum]